MRPPPPLPSVSEPPPELFPLVYDELRELARRYLSRERSDHTLQPTALVHEAWVRLDGRGAGPWKDPSHFFATAARAMRRILIDHARRRRADKRGGGKRAASLDEEKLGVTDRDDYLVALDDALEELAAIDERQARVVELRFFAGLTIPEVAEVLGWSHATVERDWRVARASLDREIRRGDDGGVE